MNKEQFAAMLNGREYGNEITRGECDIAKELGLVVVYAYSDDNMEFRGAINDEVGCWDGGTAYLTGNGLFNHESDCCDCPYAERERTKCKTVKAVWHNGGNPCWTYETDIPHATFNIYEDGELWCVGIVFEMVALAAQEDCDRLIPRPIKCERTLVGNYRCPNCGAAFMEGPGLTPFCGNCGQALLLPEVKQS
jgi:hypothetical protein